MKAILIDPVAKTVTDVEPDHLHGLQQLVGGSIELAFNWHNGDVLYVDEDGIRHGGTPWLFVLRPDQLLLGRGVIVGREVEGPEYPRGYDNLPPTITRDEVEGLVGFAL